MFSSVYLSYNLSTIATVIGLLGSCNQSRWCDKGAVKWCYLAGLLIRIGRNRAIKKPTLCERFGINIKYIVHRIKNYLL